MSSPNTAIAVALSIKHDWAGTPVVRLDDALNLLGSAAIIEGFTETLSAFLTTDLVTAADYATRTIPLTIFKSITATYFGENVSVRDLNRVGGGGE